MIRYPKGQQPKLYKSNHTKRIDYGSRGMSLEDLVNQSNLYYQSHDIAVIHKKPTPIQVVQVDYPRRSAARITEAYYRRASTTDYNGVYRGYYIDFEAKETQNKTRFPLANIPQHQLDHMSSCIRHGGLAFIILSLKYLNEYYLLPYSSLEQYLSQTHRSSISFDCIRDIGILIPIKTYPILDYLKAVDSYLENR